MTFNDPVGHSNPLECDDQGQNSRLHENLSMLWEAIHLPMTRWTKRPIAGEDGCRAGIVGQGLSEKPGMPSLRWIKILWA